jgi:hypothetical protein
MGACDGQAGAETMLLPFPVFVGFRPVSGAYECVCMGQVGLDDYFEGSSQAIFRRGGIGSEPDALRITQVFLKIAPSSHRCNGLGHYMIPAGPSSITTTVKSKLNIYIPVREPG